eukprot:TRINITY_DN64360_c0_g1_i1.p1 TRINITY_DN64360_c0_g1~~TRINITY_DN64360_c0_g1_i1.p1  ORF type:complete len:428 (-),score=134.60 TRINITY_DN64360_c0_g1_i1:56-1279(-)
MSQEHQEYIQSKVNPILESLVTEVLLERPDNPVPFMVRWLAEKSKQGKDSLYALGVGEAERLRTEIRELQEEIKDLKDKVGQAATILATGGDSGEAQERADSEEEDDDEGDEDFAPPPAAYLNKPRGSVSAEAYGAFNEKKAFVPPVYAKTAEQEERIKVVLKKSFLFNSLSKDDMKVILDAFLEKHIEAGQRIIQEGDDGDVMFLIESGAFDCIKIINGEDKVVKKCGQGDVFGELALLYNCPRAASVQATSSSVVWQLDRETFGHIVQNAASKRRDAFMDFLKSVPLFEPLESYDLMQLADCLQTQKCDAGERIISQGESGDTFYLVEEGELAALKVMGEEPEKEVKLYQRGSYFGELALLHNEPRAASVVAKTEATVVKIDQKSFDNILGQLKEAMTKAAAAYT